MQTSQTFMGLSAEAWIVTIISILITIIVGYYFHLKSKKEPIACYSIRSLKVVDVAHSSSYIGENITINYGDKPIPRVSVANVTFWNAGTAFLPGETLLPNHPLRISISPGGKFLEATIANDPNSECECKLWCDPHNFPNSVLLKFNFLDPHNGVTVRLLHTGQKGEIYVEGKLKGVRLEDACSSGKKYDSIMEFLNYSGMYLFGIIIFTFVALVQFHTWIGLPPVFFDFLLSNSSIITKFLLGLSLLGMVSTFFISFIKKTTSYRIPNQLESS